MFFVVCGLLLAAALSGVQSVSVSAPFCTWDQVTAHNGKIYEVKDDATPKNKVWLEGQCNLLLTSSNCQTKQKFCTWRDTTNQNALVTQFLSQTGPSNAPHVDRFASINPSTHVSTNKVYVVRNVGIANFVYIVTDLGENIAIDSMENPQSMTSAWAALTAAYGADHAGAAPPAPKHLVYTHSHPDHIGGGCFFCQLAGGGATKCATIQGLANPTISDLQCLSATTPPVPLLSIYVHFSFFPNLQAITSIGSALTNRSVTMGGLYLEGTVPPEFSGNNGYAGNAIGPIVSPFKQAPVIPPPYSPPTVPAGPTIVTGAHCWNSQFNVANPPPLPPSPPFFQIPRAPPATGSVTVDGLPVFLLCTPGETTDHLTVNFRLLNGGINPTTHQPTFNVVAVSGDNIYKSYPNQYTLRGTTGRDPVAWANSLTTLLALSPDVLIPMHTEPISPKAVALGTLSAYRDAMNFVLSQTLAAINSPDTTQDSELIGRQVAGAFVSSIPQTAYSAQLYGFVRSSSKGIYDFYLGYFSGNPVDLSPLTKSDFATRLIKMAGTDAAVESAHDALRNGSADDLQWALQLSDAVRRVCAANAANDAGDDAGKKRSCAQADRINLAALKFLGYQQVSSTTRNWYLTNALQFKPT